MLNTSLGFRSGCRQLLVFSACVNLLSSSTWFRRSLKWAGLLTLPEIWGESGGPRKREGLSHCGWKRNGQDSCQWLCGPASQFVLDEQLSHRPSLGTLSPAWVPASGAFGLCWETQLPISKCLSTCCVLGGGGCDRTPVLPPRR